MREWAAEQNAVSWTALLVGAGSLTLLFPGSFVHFAVRGLTPWESLVETSMSAAQSAILATSAILGLVAMGMGWGLFGRMPTKPAREAVISGAALGAQAVIFAGMVHFLRIGENFDLFVRQNFRLELLSEFTGQFVNGAKNTVVLAASGEALGIFLGLCLALLVMSSRAVVRAPARIYINFFRGTPLIWQLAFFGFGVVLGMRLPLSIYQVAIIVLGLNAGAYTAEIFRGGIQSIERGQVEASRSLGMSYLQSMRYVILPQAFRRVIPPLTNEFIILIKDTSLVFILGLTFDQRELFAVGRDAYAERFNATLFLGSVLGYLAVTLPMIRVVTWLETKLRSGMVGSGR